MPGRVAATTVAQPITGTPPPSWLPAGAEVPIPPAPPDLPFISQPVVVGALGGPAVFAPAWANEPPAPPEEISIGKKILLWAGVVAGAGILLLGLLGIPFALSQGDTTRVDDITSAVLVIIVGGLIVLPCLGVLLGFGPAVAGTFHSLGILGVIYVLGSNINHDHPDYGPRLLAVTSPGGYPFIRHEGQDDPAGPHRSYEPVLQTDQIFAVPPTWPRYARRVPERSRRRRDL